MKYINKGILVWIETFSRDGRRKPGLWPGRLVTGLYHYDDEIKIPDLCVALFYSGHRHLDYRPVYRLVMVSKPEV